MSEFWWGVLVSGLVGIPLSIFANWVTPHFLRFIEGRSASVKAGSRKSAIATYRRRKKLATNDLYRQGYYLTIQTLALWTGAMGFGFFAAVLPVLIIARYSDHPGRETIVALCLVMGVISLFAVLVAMTSILSLIHDAAAVSDFEAYKRSVAKRFGADAVEEPHAALS